MWFLINGHIGLEQLRILYKGFSIGGFGCCTSPNTALQEGRGLHKRKSRHRREPTTPKRTIQRHRDKPRRREAAGDSCYWKQTDQAEAPLPLNHPGPQRGPRTPRPQATRQQREAGARPAAPAGSARESRGADGPLGPAASQDLSGRRGSATLPAEGGRGTGPPRGEIRRRAIASWPPRAAEPHRSVPARAAGAARTPRGERPPHPRAGAAAPPGPRGPRARLTCARRSSPGRRPFNGRRPPIGRAACPSLWSARLLVVRVLPSPPRSAAPGGPRSPPLLRRRCRAARSRQAAIGCGRRLSSPGGPWLAAGSHGPPPQRGSLRGVRVGLVLPLPLPRRPRRREGSDGGLGRREGGKDGEPGSCRACGVTVREPVQPPGLWCCCSERARRSRLFVLSGSACDWNGGMNVYQIL